MKELLREEDEGVGDKRTLKEFVREEDARLVREEDEG
jgi:hypothetical protein